MKIVLIRDSKGQEERAGKRIIYRAGRQTFLTRGRDLISATRRKTGEGTQGVHLEVTREVAAVAGASLRGEATAAMFVPTSAFRRFSESPKHPIDCPTSFAEPRES